MNHDSGGGDGRLSVLAPRLSWRPGQARRLALVLVLLATASLPCLGLTDEELFRDPRFNFVSPGARALGMGGASVAIVEDVAAAWANPAGLHFVARPEAMVEIRFTDEDSQTVESRLGSLAVDTGTGDRDLPFLGLRSVSESETVTAPTFLGVAWPLELTGWDGRHLTLAASRQVLAEQDRSLGASGTGTEARFSFESFPNTVNGGRVQAYSVATPVTGYNRMDVVYWNASASLETHQDFSLGLTLSFVTLDMDAATLTRVIDPQELFLDPSHPRLGSQPGSDLYETAIDDSDSDVSFTLGLHWHPDSAFASGRSPWRFGAVYREGVSFVVDERTTLNDIPEDRFETTFVVPDRFGIAVGYQAPAHWTVTAEVERIAYSDMLEGFRSGVNFLTSDRLADGAFGSPSGSRTEFTVDDGTVYRLGGEYVLALRGAAGGRIALRGGWFRTPDSRIRMSSFGSDDSRVNATVLSAFPAGEEQDHFTLGAGFTFGPSSIELAGETSDLGSQVVASYSYSFGGKASAPPAGGQP